MPRISVILISVNHAKYICEAIDSTINQTYTDFELIILDDASSDNSWDLIKQYSDPRIKPFRSEGQGEVTGRLNNAILELAAGEYIAIHHSDNVWELDKLEKQVAFLDANPETGAVFTWVQMIDEHGVKLTNDWFDQENKTRWQWLNQLFVEDNHLSHPSVLIRKLCYEEVGVYRLSLFETPDAEIWSRVLIKFPVHIIQEKLTKHRRFSDKSNVVSVHLPLFKRGIEGDLSNKISPNPSFSKRGTEHLPNVSGDRIESVIRASNEWNVLRENYLSITNFDDIVATFPNLERFRNQEGFNNKFLLAMACLYECKQRNAWQLGLRWLFELLKDKTRYKKIRELYSFSYMDFIRLTAEFDVYFVEGEQLIASLQEQVQNLLTGNVWLTSLTDVWKKTILERERSIVSLQAYVQDLQAGNAWLTAQCEAWENYVQDLQTGNAWLTSQCEAWENTVAERDEAWENTVAERDKAWENTVAERDAEINGIYISYSWRLTRPLRFFERLIRDPKSLFAGFHKSDSPSDALPVTPSDTPSDALPGISSDTPSNVLPGISSDTPSDVLPGTPSDMPSDALPDTPSDMSSDALPVIPSDSPSDALPGTPSDTPSDALSGAPSDTPYKVDILNLGVNSKNLLVVHEFSRTGAPYAVLYLARALFSLHGVRPVIISPKDGSLREEFEQEGFSTIVDPLLFSYQDYSMEAFNFVANFESVIVTSLASFSFIRLFRGIAKHLTWWIHETGVGFTTVVNMAADLPLLFAACESIWLGSPLCFPFALLYTSQNKLHLLLYGCVDTAIARRPHKSGKVVFSIVGSVEQRKGQDIFLNAIERLSEELRGKAIFRVIGSPLPFEESAIFYKEVLTRAALIPEVECIENMSPDRLLEFYAETDVLVSASRDDPMPIVITQGLMFSKVCLCSSVIGHAQLLEDRKDGLIFTNESAEELSEKMAWLLQNPAELAVLGKAGRKIYEKYFLMSSFVNNVGKLIQNYR